MNIGYKKLRGGYIAKLEIFGKTNENRQDIADPLYAKYRTSNVKVLKIFHMNSEVNDETRVIDKMRGLYDKNFSYIVGEEMHVFGYDENINEVCSQGIHYFKTPYQAKMWNLSLDNYTGKYIEWYDDGTLRREGEYKDGNLVKWEW